MHPETMNNAHLAHFTNPENPPTFWGTSVLRDIIAVWKKHSRYFIIFPYVRKHQENGTGSKQALEMVQFLISSSNNDHSQGARKNVLSVFGDDHMFLVFFRCLTFT